MNEKKVELEQKETELVLQQLSEMPTQAIMLKP